MCGGTRLDRVRNKYVRGDLRLSNVSSKTRKNRLKWFEYRNDEVIVMGKGGGERH